MIAFLHETLQQSGRYTADLFTLATSAADASSVGLARPATWLRGVQYTPMKWRDIEYIQVGALGSELEFQRYKPRHRLSRLLQQYDLVQFVVGSPPWLCAAADVKRPIVLWTATTTRADRESQLRNHPPLRRAWTRAMLSVAERYERRALRRADAVFALSNYTRDFVRSISGRSDVSVATSGVDTSLFRPGSDPASDGHILCVARFSDPRKNVRLLLTAYRKLLDRRPDTPALLLVGEPPTDAGRAFLAELHLTDRVRLLGPKRGEELAALYRNARLFVLSSDEEGLAIVVLEAMASGLPVISTDCGGPGTAIIPEVTGLLTPVGDALALSGAIERALSDDALRQRMGRAGRDRAVTHFSLEAAGKVFLETYDRILGDAAPAPANYASPG